MSTRHIDVSEIALEIRKLLSRFAVTPDHDKENQHHYKDDVRVMFKPTSSVVDFCFETKESFQINMSFDFNEVFRKPEYINDSIQKLLICLDDARRHSQEKSRIVLH